MAKGGAAPAKGKQAKAGGALRKCPACGTEAVYPAGPVPCKVCGTIVPPLGAAPPSVPPALAATPPAAWQGVPAQPPADGPTALAIISLVCGILAAMTLWVLPLCLLLGGIAIVTGIVAATQQDGSPGTKLMAGFGIGLGALAILVMWWAFAYVDDGGSSVYISSGDDTSNDGGSGSGGGGGDGGDGGSSGGSGGSSGEGGGSGDSGDSGDSGGSGDTGDTGGDSGGSGGGGDTAGGGASDSEAPAPVAMLVGLGLLGAAAWRRRA